jgi:hypothetical protein
VVKAIRPYWQVIGDPVQVVPVGQTRMPAANSGEVQSAPAATVPWTDMVKVPLLVL